LKLGSLKAGNEYTTAVHFNESNKEQKCTWNEVEIKKSKIDNNNKSKVAKSLTRLREYSLANTYQDDFAFIQKENPFFLANNFEPIQLHSVELAVVS